MPLPSFFGYLATHEIYFYILDALPLWLSMSLYALLWPPRVVEACREGERFEMGGKRENWTRGDGEGEWGGQVSDRRGW